MVGLAGERAWPGCRYLPSQTTNFLMWEFFLCVLEVEMIGRKGEYGGFGLPGGVTCYFTCVLYLYLLLCCMFENKYC